MKRALDIGLHPGIATNYLWDLERVIPSIISLICKMRRVDLYSLRVFVAMHLMLYLVMILK